MTPSEDIPPRFTVYLRRSAYGDDPVSKLNGRWQRHVSIDTDWQGGNELTLCRQGPTLDFLINGEKVFTTTHEDPERHRFFGVNVSQGTQAFVRNTAICQQLPCGVAQD